MSNKIVRLMLIPVLLLAFSSSTLVGELPQVDVAPRVEARQLDERARVLAQYFASHNSPFEYQAQNFVDAADKYGLDWKLVPAIAGVESTFGKHTYGYNAWGWGIYGDNRLGFSSWKDGIETVSQGLKKNYVDKGLTDPYSMNRVYAASKSWGWKVDFFMKDMEKFENTYEPQARSVNPLIKTAESSAQLAYKI